MTGIRFLLLFFCIWFFVPSLHAKVGIPDPSAFLQDISIVRISSVSQKLLDSNCVELQGDVDIMLDTAMHIRADRVHFDQEKKTLTAFGPVGGALLFESPTIVMLADSFFIDLKQGEGRAENIRFHSGDKYISAKKGALHPNSKWFFDHITYTSCDHTNPHWSFTARSASMNDTLMRAKTICFRVKNIPILWIPGIIVPSSYKKSSQRSSSSGFLIPRLAWDKHLGFGITQEYYASFARHLDSLIGINWREKKGYMLYDRFRYARSPQDFTLFNVQFAHELNAFVEKNNEIIKGHKTRYWVEGKNFQHWESKKGSLDTLLCVDVGTDKQIGYEFFGKTDGLEDHFYNSVIIRPHTPSHVFSLQVDSDAISRERFNFSGPKINVEEKYALLRAPHLEYSSVGFTIPYVNIDVRSHAMVDYAYAKEKVEQKIFVDSEITQTNTVVPFEKEHTFRLNYEAALSKQVNLFSNVFKGEVAPLVQFRSRVNKPAGRSFFENRFLGEGAYRLSFQTFLEWALPEIRYNANRWSSYINPRLNFNCTTLPAFHADTLFLMDEFDYVYPKTEIEGSLTHDIFFNGGSSFGWYAKQSYEFNAPSFIFPLRRPVRHTHWLPLKLGAYSDVPCFHFETEHEIDAARADLLQSKVDCTFHYNRFRAGVTLIHQRPKLQIARELLSDIPSFAIVHLKTPLMYNLDASYQGHFYSHSNSLIGGIKDPHPSYHQLRFEYKGHCWNVMAGYEEKRYRQEGSIKSEQAFLFSFALTSFGSFSKHFKKEPEIINAPASYSPKV